MVVSMGKLLKVQYATMQSGRKIRTDAPKPPNAAEITLDTGARFAIRVKRAKEIESWGIGTAVTVTHTKGNTDVQKA
jgi:hypothetical protein